MTRGAWKVFSLVADFSDLIPRQSYLQKCNLPLCRGWQILRDLPNRW